ncbi:HU family DNA-binding protein [Candidatus Marinimicrobia bacterium MT.SAG.3]|nr:HU family DNA-binding protein [Candidatus Neomarinimicrobiota bacterium]TFB10054.1 HU family DNA-binding protein [Candidatus Marinimicrobia bacterium MT.SAG.2]TFB12161.1 HU family DNA-binding protein [Candidatus Marinimicrobia bacterium MT.SAG.3]
MNKQELIAAIATDSGLTKVEAEKALNSVTSNITAALTKKDKVTLVGFGTFSTSDRAARIGRNPRTGESINIAATTVPKFKAGKELKAAIKGL